MCGNSVWSGGFRDAITAEMERRKGMKAGSLSLPKTAATPATEGVAEQSILAPAARTAAKKSLIDSKTGANTGSLF